MIMDIIIKIAIIAIMGIITTIISILVMLKKCNKNSDNENLKYRELKNENELEQFFDDIKFGPQIYINLKNVYDKWIGGTQNGKIYNNYEAKNGRIFGLKRASLCFQLEDEIVQNN